MQYHMSSASAPDPAAGFPAAEPQPAAPRPAVVPGRHKRRGPRLLLLAAVLAAMAVAAAVYLKTGAGRHKGSGATTITLRTAPVVFGDLQRTVRISGVVQAEKFAAIMAPQLHGSHSDRGRGGLTGNASTSVTMPSTAGMGSSGVSSSSSSSSSASTSSDPSIGSSSGSDDTPGGSGGLGQQRGSARVSGFSSGGSSHSSSKGSSGGGSSKSVGDAADLGSTSGSLMRGGGGSILFG